LLQFLELSKERKNQIVQKCFDQLVQK